MESIIFGFPFFNFGVSKDDQVRRVISKKIFDFGVMSRTWWGNACSQSTQGSNDWRIRTRIDHLYEVTPPEIRETRVRTSQGERGFWNLPRSKLLTCGCEYVAFCRWIQRERESHFKKEEGMNGCCMRASGVLYCRENVLSCWRIWGLWVRRPEVLPCGARTRDCPFGNWCTDVSPSVNSEVALWSYNSQLIKGVWLKAVFLTDFWLLQSRDSHPTVCTTDGQVEPQSGIRRTLVKH